MRCPKCHYVSFDGQSRCRNCGYDFSLAQPSEPVDVSTRAGNTSATPLADLSLKPDTPTASTSPSSSVVDDAIASSPNGMTGAGTARARTHDTDPLDLPLFGPTPHSVSRERDRERAAEEGPGPERGRDREAFTGAGGGAAGLREEMRERERRNLSDRPLVNPAPPRPPLAVRRTTGDVPRARARVTPTQPLPMGDEPRLELDPPERERARDRGRVQDRDAALERGARGASASPADSASTASVSTSARSAASDEPLALGFDADIDQDASDVDASREASPDVSRGPAVRFGFGFGVESASDAASSASTSEALDESASSAVSAAPLARRVIAALIDVAFLAAVDATVLHFTLRLTGLGFSIANLQRLPLMPLLGFLGLLNGGYLAMFTAASGQTMGKMVTGVKVVSMRGDTVPFGNAVLRAILWLLTIVPAGVGFIPALLTDDRRALHDRLADTRVVKVD